MKLVVVIFAMTVTSLTVFKTFVHGKMFNCKMTEEPTMTTAEEAAQRVYAKKLAADRESKKRKRAGESQEQRETRLDAKRESEKRRSAEVSQEQHENRLAADRESKKRKRSEESQEQPEKTWGTAQAMIIA